MQKYGCPSGTMNRITGVVYPFLLVVYPLLLVGCFVYPAGLGADRHPWERRAIRDCNGRSTKRASQYCSGLGCPAAPHRAHHSSDTSEPWNRQAFSFETSMGQFEQRRCQNSTLVILELARCEMDFELARGNTQANDGWTKEWDSRRAQRLRKKPMKTLIGFL